MDDIDFFYKRTLASLRLLSMPFEMQKSFFEEFVDAPFEVLDTYNDVFLQLPKLVEADRFSNAETASLINLYNMINIVSNNPQLKELDENLFSSHELWNKIREQAKDVLVLLNEPVEMPDPNYL